MVAMCAFTTYGYTHQTSRAKGAYLTNNINELVNIAISDNEENALAADFLSLLNLSELDYITLKQFADKTAKSTRHVIHDLFSDLLKSRQIEVLDSLSNMTAEELTRFEFTNPQYQSLISEYTDSLSQGLDSLSFHELRYLRLNCPSFNDSKIKIFSKLRRNEITEELEKQMKGYCEFEKKSMQWFTAALQYEILEGFFKQFKQFAAAYSMDDNMEESDPSYIYDAYMELLRQYWNEGIIYDYVMAQTKNYNESINNARTELLGNLGIKGKKQNVITIPRVDVGIALGIGGFNKIGEIRSELNGTEFGASIVAGLASFITGGFLSGVGKSLYMSSEKGNAAQAELPHRRAYLLATYDKLLSKTEKEMESLAKELQIQQNKQSQIFYEYVLENY